MQRGGGLAVTAPQNDGRHEEIERGIRHLQALNVPAQRFRGFKLAKGHDPPAQQHQPRQIHQRSQRAEPHRSKAPVFTALFRESERKVQEQCRLQQLSDDVAPVDNRVKRIELAGVMERVQNERHEAENIKMRGFRRGPAAEENVKTDAQVDQCDQAQSLLHGIVRRNGNHGCDFYIDALTIQEVRGPRIHTRAIEVPFFFDIVLDGLVFRQAVDAQQPVADFDAGLLSRTIGSDALRHQRARLFLPPHAVGRSNVLPFFLPVDIGKDNRGGREEGQHNG